MKYQLFCNGLPISTPNASLEHLRSYLSKWLSPDGDANCFTESMGIDDLPFIWFGDAYMVREGQEAIKQIEFVKQELQKEIRELDDLISGIVSP